MKKLGKRYRNQVLAVFIFISLFGISHQTISPLLVNAESVEPGKGLYVSPATEYESINAGSQKTEYFTVANHTDNSLVITLSIKQFTVNSYSYTYNFTAPQDNWLHLVINRVVLAPGTSESIPYTITVPVGSLPGGSYYTFVASANLGSGSIATTVQAAITMFLTVNGKLIYTSKLVSASIQRFMFGSQIAYKFDVINTGNVYFFIYVSGKLNGITAQSANFPVTHMVIPGKIRQFTGVIPHPFLPGVYRAVYGYTTDTGEKIQQSSLIFYFPPWLIAVILVLLIGVNLWYTRRIK